jgi:hypothetical protein
VKRTRSKNGRRLPQTSWPDGFFLDDDLADHAAEKAGWDHGRAFEEFSRFENHHRAKGSIFADWRAAWRTWVSNGIRFDRDRTQQQAGITIDQNGNPVASSPPNRPPPPNRQPYRQRSHFDMLEDDGQ